MAHKIDVSRGECRGDVSAQFMSRPADERFNDLHALRAQVHEWAERSEAFEVSPTAIDLDVTEVEVTTESGDRKLVERLGFSAPHIGEFTPTPFGFDSLCSLAGVPRNFARAQVEKGGVALAAANLTWGLANRDDAVSLYAMDAGKPGSQLRAITSPKYGRIHDWMVADQLVRVAGSGRGEQRWKSPGCINWGNMTYDPEAAAGSTFFASDRDLFCFLCDDRNPIEVGLLADGSPDLMFRGIIVWNSEVGSKTFGVSTMLLRGVCCNRNLWGCEDFQTIEVRHNSGAPEKFLEEAAPQLIAYAEASTATSLTAIGKARAITFDAKDEERTAQFGLLVDRLGFSRKVAEAILATDPDGHGKATEPCLSAWDLSQRATAWAREIAYQDERVAAERKIGGLMKKLTA